MQGPECEANCDLRTLMVPSEDSNGVSICSEKIHKVDCRVLSGTCHVCSASCSSCFHVNKVPMKSNDESAGETCAENIEIGQVSELSTVAGMNSASDSLSENAVGKASSRTSNASASDDSVVHSKSEGPRVPECHDDCLSCVSATDEHANRKSTMEESKIESNKQSRISGESSDKVHHISSPTGIDSQSSDMVEVPFSKSSDDASDLLKVQNTFSQASNGECLSHCQSLRDVKDDKPSDSKNEMLRGSTEHLDLISARVIASDVVCGDTPATALKSIKNDNLEVEVHPDDESDDSDMVEHDVKVCDICGDAGREDLLAICCQCSDGAEHTYCMREMLDKVPEGEWLCEECKSAEQVGNERQEKDGRVDENGKNNSSGQASSEYINSSDVEGRRTKGYMRIPSKRHRDDADAEVSSTVKKPANEPIAGLPKATNFSKAAALSRENSSKNLDKGRLLSSHNASSDAVPVNDATESASSASDLRVHNIRGILSKSNSFNSLNSKPKVKLVDQVVIQRQKSAREHGSFRVKEGAVRSIGKSMSFKSTVTSRSESKIKMLSPRLSHIQDSKNTKQRSPFERQRSFRTEQSSINSTIITSVSATSRIDKRPASRGESSSLTTIANHDEKKHVQTDGISSTLPKSSSLAARRTADLSNSLGEFKRPTIHSQSTPGVLSANGVNNNEHKSYQTSLKEDSSPGPVVAERPAFNEVLPDGLLRPRDLTSSGERMREYSGSRFGPSSLKSPRNESDNLKAAIEAAVLRKPGVSGKHRALGQSDDSSVSSVGCEVAPQQQHLSSSGGKKKLTSDEDLTTVSQKLSADSLKQETPNNVKQTSLAPVEGLSSGGSGVHIGPSLKDVFNNVPAAMPLLLKSLAIPEHEYIWQGSFEICQSGKFFHSWDGIQAHLSTCASPKVLEAVNNFKSRITLYEVPRLSTWPIQFQENGVREDNIALFFFAKDLESYDKIYKVLLDNMMKNDLALKGNVDGIELLIFPSNQLPEKLQRWNTLFFLWGVFRGKKESSLQHMPESLNQFTAPLDIPPPIMSLSENRCSPRPIGEDLSVNEDASPVVEAPASKAVQNLLSSRANGDCVVNESSLDELECRLSSNSSAAVQSDSAKRCKEMRGIFQEGSISSHCSSPSALRNSSCPGKEQVLMQLDSPLDKQHSLHYPGKSVAGPLNEGIGEGTLLNKTFNQDHKLRMDARDLSMDGENPLEDNRDTKDLNIEHNKWLFNHEECMHPGSSVKSQTFYAGTSQVSLRNDDRHDATCGALGKMNHLPSGTYALQNLHHEACFETYMPECDENAERHFFPIESQPVKGICFTEGSLPWEMPLLEKDRLNDKAPNLELALGAERKPLTSSKRPVLVSKVDHKVNEEHVVEQGGAKEEDDVSASLSLSLSFPFPEKELSKPAPKVGQLMSERESVNTSMVLFGDLRDN
ncbi:hypothetical protein CDL12_27130 [Handroanthus impetiginosus]|uniref:Zinc finger PHD-type domain-containing protein n=1 Tax=Handroanthus impetiginosus TaxID=429701 RepID=A0A2G9G4X5_9LAMI|nr:hypothetical protein CDL12_27130 [Handroanthus impetiginosus]